MARILIADNASFMRSCLKYIVENAGHEVVGMAKGGSEAVDLFRQLQPDIVTLDILMEGMDGIEALGKIITHELGNSGPGVFTFPGICKLKMLHKAAVDARKGIDPFTKKERTFKAREARTVFRATALKALWSNLT